MQAGILYVDPPYRKYSYVLSVLVLLSSIVIADPKSQIDLPDEFTGLSTDTVFNRGEEVKDNKIDNEWRKPKKEPDQSNVRWGATSIYDNNENIDPFFSGSEKTKEVTDTPEAARQIQIRF